MGLWWLLTWVCYRFSFLFVCFFFFFFFGGEFVTMGCGRVIAMVVAEIFVVGYGGVWFLWLVAMGFCSWLF